MVCSDFLNIGVGKTTLVQKVCEGLASSGVGLEGFYTEEVREGGRRVGFDVVTVTGERGCLSKIRFVYLSKSNQLPFFLVSHAAFNRFHFFSFFYFQEQFWSVSWQTGLHCRTVCG